MDLGTVGIWGGQGWYGEPSEVAGAAAEVEELGFGTIWMSGGFGPGVDTRFQTLLAATSQIKVASGIVSIWHGAVPDVAAAFAGFEDTSPGRFLLGLGASHAVIVDNADRSYEKPYSKMVGYLDELDAAAPTVAPERRALAALGPRMLKLAAERSLGAHPYFVPVEHTAAAREVLGTGPLLAPEQAVVLETDADAARAIAREHTAGYLSLPNYSNNLRRYGFSDEDLAGAGSDRLVDAIVAWGDADAIGARVRAHLAAGADHVCLQVLTADGGFPRDEYRAIAAALLP